MSFNINPQPPAPWIVIPPVEIPEVPVSPAPSPAEPPPDPVQPAPDPTTGFKARDMHWELSRQRDSEAKNGNARLGGQMMSLNMARSRDTKIDDVHLLDAIKRRESEMAAYQQEVERALVRQVEENGRV